MSGFRWTLLWPVFPATLCLVTLCVFVAVSLFHQQATVARVFRENVEGRKVAVELEECLTDLIAMEKAHIESVSPLHDRVRAHIRSIEQIADEPEEQRLANRMNSMFTHYLQRWQSLPPPEDPAHDQAVREAAKFLEQNVLGPCAEFRLYTGRKLDENTSRHARVLNHLGWGMAGIAVLSTIAGVLFGFGVARALNRTIRRLQVQIQDAAGKLKPVVPEIVLRTDGEFGTLHDEIESLTKRIEFVVQELHAREREVARAEQLAAVGQLAAGVGHEIRNPLTSIKMLVQAAIEDPDQSQLTLEDLKVIEGEIRRMERSLKTFLEFARPPKPERRPVDVMEIIGAVVGLVRGRAEKQRVTTRVEGPTGPVMLTADPGQLHQVLVNIILNSLDSMPGGGTVNLKVQATPQEVSVEITDSGPGIPRDVMSRLFQPFVSTKETGLGLGLVISRRIIEEHGGTIGAANAIGGGATFQIRLPRDCKRIG